MDDTLLEEKLKQLLIRECDKEDDIDWQSIDNDEPLFGQQSRIQMDSLDALQVSLALQQHYGVRIEGAKDGRRILNSIASIAAFIRQKKVTPVYLQRGALHSVLGDDLHAAGQALRDGRLPTPIPFLLHELQQPRPFFGVQASDENREQRLDRLLEETLGDAAEALDDCLLIVASTSLDINDLESRVAHEGGFQASHSTPLDRVAEQLRQRWGFADAFTLNTACTSAANGLLYGARLLGGGLFQRCLVVSFETPSAIARQGFGALDLTSQSGRYRPFHPERDGLILGEAYAATLLSLQPGPKPLARLLGGFSACDTSNLTTTREDGSHIDWVMRQALRSAGKSVAEIGLVKLHGTATSANDRAEHNGVRLLFGECLPALCVLKPWLGHTLGACGLSEILLLVENLACLPGVDYADEATLPLSGEPFSVAESSLLLANFFGFGGNNASLVLQRGAGDAA